MPPKTAKRKTGKPAASQSRKETSASRTGAATTADAVEQKFVALAEQMGRLIGTVQAKAEGWLDPKYMRDQITRIQDGATDLLSHLGNVAGKSTEPALSRPSGHRAAAAAARSMRRARSIVRRHHRRGRRSPRTIASRS